MARNGSGDYSLPEAAFVAGTVVDNVAVNNNFSDIANALSGSLAADGQKAATGNLPLGGNRITGLGNGTARTDAISVGQIQDDSVIWCGTAGGTANAITLTPSPAITDYAAGQRFRFEAANYNTGATTITVSGLTAKNVYAGSGELAGHEIWDGRFYEVWYDGTKFNLLEIDAAPKQRSRNWVINPLFDVAQHAVPASVAGSAAYVLDQWKIDPASATVTTSRQSHTVGAAPIHEGEFFLRCNGDGNFTITQPIEDVRSLAGKKITLSFFLRAGSAGPVVTPTIRQHFGSGGSSDVDTSPGSFGTSTGWGRYWLTFDLPSISGKTIGAGNYLEIRLAITSAAGVNMDLAYVQLEAGPRYTLMQPRTKGEEIALCQRYYQHTYNDGTAAGAVSLDGQVITIAMTSSRFSEAFFSFQPRMRAAPTVTVYSPNTGAAGKAHDNNAVADVDVATDVSAKRLFIASPGSTFTTNNVYTYQWVADARL